MQTPNKNLEFLAVRKRDHGIPNLFSFFIKEKGGDIERTIRHTVDTYCTMICTSHLFNSYIQMCSLDFAPCNVRTMLIRAQRSRDLQGVTNQTFKTSP